DARGAARGPETAATVAARRAGMPRPVRAEVGMRFEVRGSRFEEDKCGGPSATAALPPWVGMTPSLAGYVDPKDCGAVGMTRSCNWVGSILARSAWICDGFGSISILLRAR